MNMILADLTGKFVLVYINDILVFSPNEEKDVNNLQLVFNQLKDARFKLKPAKCAFGLPEVQLLGYILNEQCIQTELTRNDVRFTWIEERQEAFD